MMKRPKPDISKVNYYGGRRCWSVMSMAKAKRDEVSLGTAVSVTGTVIRNMSFYSYTCTYSLPQRHTMWCIRCDPMLEVMISGSSTSPGIYVELGLFRFSEYVFYTGFLFNFMVLFEDGRLPSYFKRTFPFQALVPLRPSRMHTLTLRHPKEVRRLTWTAKRGRRHTRWRWIPRSGGQCL
jgi:hypothetical protein